MPPPRPTTAETTPSPLSPLWATTPTYVALEALKAAGSTNAKAVYEALPGVTYTGVTGAIAFDDVNGDAVRDTAYIKVADNANTAWNLETEQKAE